MIYNPPNNEHPIGQLLSRPYDSEIPEYQEKVMSIEKLSRDIHEVNPKYLLFHPIINSYQLVGFLMAYGFSWLFGQGIFIAIHFISKYNFTKQFELDVLFFIVMLVLYLIVMSYLPYVAYKQLKNKKSYFNKILLIKATQQIAYYEHNRKKAPVFHLIDYKDIVASVRHNKGIAFNALNLHVIDPKTKQLIQSINLEDMQLNPHDQPPMSG